MQIICEFRIFCFSRYSGGYKKPLALYAVRYLYQKEDGMKKTKTTDTATSLTQKILEQREKNFPVNLKIQKSSQGFRRLSTEEVYRNCDQKLVEIDKHKKSEPNYDIISQVRAVRAINLGLGIQKPGYNIYVAGVQGTGKTSVIRSFLKKTAERCPTPGDWIYVYNFKNPESPHTMELKTGIAKRFKKQMDELMEQLTVELVDAFQSEE